MEKYFINEKFVLRVPRKPLKYNFNKHELVNFFLQEENQEALFLASPVLLNEFNKWRERGSTKQPPERLLHSLLKYVLRMHARCTPFGLFAGCNVVKVGHTDEILINPSQKNRNTRLDMDFIYALSQNLSNNSSIKQHLKFLPNNSIYYHHDKIRYVEYYYKKKKRIHQISSVDNSIYLHKVLKKARNGATYAELKDEICESGVSLTNSLAFINEIINAQLLISELEPSLIGNDSLSKIINTLELIQQKQQQCDLKKTIQILQNVQTKLVKIDKRGCNIISEYLKIADILKQLNIPFELSKLFQTDLFTSIITNGIKNDTKKEKKKKYPSIQKDLENALFILNKLSKKPSNTNLKEFRKRFIDRYQYAEIPLSEALDNEAGVGYSYNNNYNSGLNALIDDLIIYNKRSQERNIIWNRKESFLFSKLMFAQKKNQYIISITSDELTEFDENWDDLPDSFPILFKHLGQNDDNNIICIDHIGGSSATRTLGRFGTGSKEIEELLREISHSEQSLHPNSIIAEISHLPESRIGNVLLRPAFRDYEIPYLSNSTLPPSKQIRIDDLYVSIKHDRIFLASRSLNKEVLPRLGNAHNYSYRSLPVYHFLSDMQTYNKRKDLSFNWGSLQFEFPFLPRVEAGNVILSPAMWQLKRIHYQDLLVDCIDIEQLIADWQDEWQMPDRILYIESDNELLIDLHDRLSLNMFLSIINKKSMIFLKEFLFKVGNSIVKDVKNNEYVNELVAIVQKGNDNKIELNNFNLMGNDNFSAKKKINRNFSLGTEWLYFKLYCGIETADTILIQVINPLAHRLIEQNLIDSWFFIRYSDPDLHLRVRFHLCSVNNLGEVIRKINHSITKFLDNGLIWNIQADVYRREIERYGHNSIEIAESIFYQDSVLISNIITLIKNEEKELLDWGIGLRLIESFISCFCNSRESKYKLLTYLKESYAEEFNLNSKLIKQLNNKYRQKKDYIESMLTDNYSEENKYKKIFDLISERSENIKPFTGQLKELLNNNKLEIQLDSLLWNYLHMMNNRLFKSRQRLHEFVLYYFLWYYYRSILARKKNILNNR